MLMSQHLDRGLTQRTPNGIAMSETPSPCSDDSGIVARSIPISHSGCWDLLDTRTPVRTGRRRASYTYRRDHCALVALCRSTSVVLHETPGMSGRTSAHVPRSPC